MRGEVSVKNPALPARDKALGELDTVIRGQFSGARFRLGNLNLLVYQALLGFVGAGQLE